MGIEAGIKPRTKNRTVWTRGADEAVAFVHLEICRSIDGEWRLMRETKDGEPRPW